MRSLTARHLESNVVVDPTTRSGDRPGLWYDSPFYLQYNAAYTLHAANCVTMSSYSYNICRKRSILKYYKLLVACRSTLV